MSEIARFVGGPADGVLTGVPASAERWEVPFPLSVKVRWDSGTAPPENVLIETATYRRIGKHLFEAEGEGGSVTALQKLVYEHQELDVIQCQLLAWRGSVAHGMHVPSSEEGSIDDLDLIAVSVPAVDRVLGLREMGSRGTVEVQEGQWDVVAYDWRKALRLLAKGNPNVLSLLWMKPWAYLRVGEAGQMLLDERELFSTRAAFPAFRGYARSQLEKMTKGATGAGYMGEKRKRLVEEHGYDTKNASHLIRLLRMGARFMETGEMAVDRRGLDADELLEIKRGEYSLQDVTEEAEHWEQELERAAAASDLPAGPDADRVNDLAVRMGRTALWWR